MYSELKINRQEIIRDMATTKILPGIFERSHNMAELTSYEHCGKICYEFCSLTSKNTETKLLDRKNQFNKLTVYIINLLSLCIIVPVGVHTSLECDCEEIRIL